MKHSQKKKGIFMMTETEKLKQLERLQSVPPEVWRKVQLALVRRMTERLWGAG